MTKGLFHWAMPTRSLKKKFKGEENSGLGPGTIDETLNFQATLVPQRRSNIPAE